VAQLDEVVDCALLVLGYGQAGLGDDERLAHVILWGGPLQTADPSLVSTDVTDVLLRRRPVLAGAVRRQLREAA
jgi:hypothetical protein